MTIFNLHGTSILNESPNYLIYFQTNKSQDIQIHGYPGFSVLYSYLVSQPNPLIYSGWPGESEYSSDAPFPDSSISGASVLYKSTVDSPPRCSIRLVSFSGWSSSTSN